MRELMFVSCTAGAKEETRLHASLVKLGIGEFRFAEHNRRGLPECYNAWLDEFAGSNRILVLAHDDLVIADAFVREKLSDAVQLFDVVGLVGSAMFDLSVPVTRYDWGAWPAQCLSGAVEHVSEAGLAFWSYFGPTPQRCVVMDGVFLAVDMLTVGRVRFDERFGFHLYDLDFCLAAHRAGLVCGTTNIYGQHASRGNYAGPEYAAAMAAFQEKWRAVEAAEGTPLRIRVDKARSGPVDAAGAVGEGDALLEAGHPEAAQEAYRRAYAAWPEDERVLARVGRTVQLEGLLDVLIVDCQRQVAQSPDDPLAHFRLGKALQGRRDVDGAIASYQHALALEPRYVAAMSNMGMALNDKGQVARAVECFRAAVAMAPELAAAHSNLVYSLHFLPGIAADEIYREHREWARRHAAGLGEAGAGYENERSPERRLRVGYVSPNFYEHPVGRMMAGLLAGHDRAVVEVFCYDTGEKSDEVTETLRRGADHWVGVAELSDAALAQRVRDERIDILVDLTMHMARNRLLTFARRPAPVQVTYLAYCSTTGLEGMDYRLSDRFMDPPGGRTDVYSEGTLRLPETYWCYVPPAEAPEVSALPAGKGTGATFASCANFAKVSPGAMAAWARILAATPGSRLIVHACAGDHRAALLEVMAGAGVAPERVEFFDRLRLREYMALYRAVDIALDPFPYSGGTTTCDALWMGVPTVTLAGAAAFMRGGLSVLSNVGLGELAATSEEEYVRIATGLAGDLARLAELRRTMRARMKASPLMDGQRLARHVEAAYRGAWRAWVAGG